MPLLAAHAAPVDACHVLMACADSQHVADVRLALDAWPQQVVLDTASSAVPALREVLLNLPSMVVVDLALDDRAGLALVRQLARLWPALPVLAFDTLACDGPGVGAQTWSWDQLATVLEAWQA